MNMKRSSSAAKARLTPPADRSAPATDTPSGPPTETVEISVGPNPDGHTDQVLSVHVAPDPADDTTDQEG